MLAQKHYWGARLSVFVKKLMSLNHLFQKFHLTHWRSLTGKSFYMRMWECFAFNAGLWSIVKLSVPDSTIMLLQSLWCWHVRCLDGSGYASDGSSKSEGRRETNNSSIKDRIGDCMAIGSGLATELYNRGWQHQGKWSGKDLLRLARIQGLPNKVAMWSIAPHKKWTRGTRSDLLHKTRPRSNQWLTNQRVN